MLTIVALSGALTGWSLVGNLVVGDRLYTTRNVVLTGFLLWLAVSLGLSWEQLGLAVTDLAAGIRWGVLAAAGAALVLTLAALARRRVRLLARLFADRRASMPPREVARHSILRIPLGTAVFEEVAFRGVLLAAAMTVTSTPVAVAVSSVIFGLWHVAPTMVALRVNHVQVRSLRGLHAVTAGVLLTVLAGIGFCLLRLWSGSLIAPILVHATTNVGSLLMAAMIQRQRVRGRALV